MNQPQRNNDQSNRPSDLQTSGADGGNLNSLRQQAAALQAAAEAAIKNALSADSRAFNASMRQEGGQ